MRRLRIISFFVQSFGLILSNQETNIRIRFSKMISAYGTAMKLAGTSFGVIGAADVEGDFNVTGSGSVGNKLANQPVKTIDFKSGVTAGVVYFVAAYDFEGFKVAGTKVTASGATVAADGVSLYTATLADSAVTVAAITPSLS